MVCIVFLAYFHHKPSDDAILKPLCFYCYIPWVHFTSSIFVILLSGLFVLPLSFLFWVHVRNFSSGLTTSERYGKHANNTESAQTERSQSNNNSISESMEHSRESISSMKSTVKVHKGVCGWFFNCGNMICPKRVTS